MNGLIDARTIPAHSTTKLWWRCDAGPDHLWRAAVYSRTDGNGCPFCAGKRASVTNSLLALRPELAAEWHPTRNDSMTAADVTCGSDRKVWWRCPIDLDHEWQATVSSRVRGLGCPFCSGRRASAKSSLAAIAPDIARQWHPLRNGTLRPSDVPAGSTRRVFWKCEAAEDHEWECTVVDRTKSRTGCPFCSGKRTSADNSLARRAPRVAREWHPTRNRGLTPRDVTPGSTRIVWWRCSKEPKHIWRACIDNRTRLKRGCPFCAGQRVSRERSLGALHPRLARQWDTERNDGRSPKDVAPSARLKVWWRCPRGDDHRWCAPVYTRTARGSQGCPFCSGHRVSKTNSLAARFPAVAREWHPSANASLTPEMVMGRSSKRVWWRCQFGHHWPARISDRTRPNGTGCPVCARGHQAAAATTFKKKRHMRAPAYEGVKRGPVKKVQ